MTFSEKTDHSNALFSRLEFLNIDDIHQFQLLAFVYDCQSRLVPAQFHDFFVPCTQIHSFNTYLAACGFWKGKTHFSMELDPLNSVVQDYGTCSQLS